MKILTINCGSSSLKFKLFSMANNSLLVKGVVDRIGAAKGSDLIYINELKGIEKKEELPINDHASALDFLLKLFVNEKYGVLSNIEELIAVGHRVIYGKDIYHDSILITNENLQILKSFIELGPLHMPANIQGIEACKDKLPNTPQVAVFDTSFHHTMPQESFMYGLPYEYYTAFGVRRYGFHGTSHKYVANQAALTMNRSLSDLNLITAHLGNGASITAIKHGKVIDTSMGFTPLEGIMMGTRSGDLDPAIVPFLQNKLNCDWESVDKILNKKSGLLGISGISNDMRDIIEKKNAGDERAKAAYNIFNYKIVKYIGAYYAAIGEKLDALIFTAGIGENSPYVRADICSRLGIFGIKISPEKNSEKSAFAKIISAKDSYLNVYVIPTDEELLIAKDTYEIYKKIK